MCGDPVNALDLGGTSLKYRDQHQCTKYTCIGIRRTCETGLAVEEALCFSPPDDREPTGLTQVGDSVIRAIREPDVAVETAEAVQDYVMARYRTVWPVCPVHRIGFHPVSADDAPAWECSAGEHRVPMLDSR
ncbi:hypothetical protein [Streptomyces sp. CoH27]|uniref:hypothetical protein n=1 Tax=Streptomyces sp. CoH27 TaxID=2875763 RepID=UPI0035A8BDFD